MRASHLPPILLWRKKAGRAYHTAAAADLPSEMKGCMDPTAQGGDAGGEIGLDAFERRYSLDRRFGLTLR